MANPLNLRTAARIAGLSAATLTTLFACSGGGSTGPANTTVARVAITPASLILTVGQTDSLRAMVTDLTGAVIPNATVVWESREPVIADVDSRGWVEASAPGMTTIVAESGGKSDSAHVVVVSATCPDPGGFLVADTLLGTLDYMFRSSGTTDGGFFIEGRYENVTQLTAKLERFSTLPSQIMFVGDMIGLASIEEAKTDPTTADTAETIEGRGPIVEVLGEFPKMTVIIDLDDCTYTMKAGVSLKIVRTQFGEIELDALVAMFNRGASALTDTLGTRPNEFEWEARSLVWSVMNEDRNAFIPLGLIAELANPTDKVLGLAQLKWKVWAQ